MAETALSKSLSNVQRLKYCLSSAVKIVNLTILLNLAENVLLHFLPKLDFWNSGLNYATKILNYLLN